MEDMGWLDKRIDVRQNNESVIEPQVTLSPAEKKVLNQLDKGECSFDQLCDCISSGDYTMDPDKRDMIVAKFWGETAGYDSSQKILDFIRQSSQK